MRTLPALASLCCLAAVGAAPEATGKGTDPPRYLPTTAGARFVYEVRLGGAVTEFTEVVTQVEARGGGLRVTVARYPGPAGKAGKASAVSVFAVSAGGLARAAARGRDLPAPEPLLKLPAKAGDTWKVGAGGPGGAGAVCTVGPEEEEEVPAGKFRAVRVETATDLGAVSLKTTSWYAPGVGLVKEVTPAGARSATRVLKSFTPGK